MALSLRAEARGSSCNLAETSGSGSHQNGLGKQTLRLNEKDM